MSEWKECKLGTVACLVKDTYKPKTGDHLPYIGLEHIQEQGLRLLSVGDSDSVTSQKFRFKCNDVLFGKLRPYFRKVVKPSFSGVCSTDIWVVRALEGNDQNFIFYFFANQEFVDTANSGDSGTRMPRADWQFVKDTIWQFPQLPEQRAIAGVLSGLDDKIDLLHRQNKTLEGMAEALWRKMFVEEADPRWDEKGLDEIAIFLNGLPCQKYPPDTVNEPLPVIKIKELRSGFTDDSDLATSAVPPEYIINDGDILFSWSGSLEVVIWSHGKGLLNQHLFKVTSDNYPKWFYYCWIKHYLPEFRDIAQDKATTMGHIQRHHLSSAKVVIPDEKSFEYLNIQISPIFEKIIHNLKAIGNYTKLRDTLLPKLMSGEVKVKYFS